VIAAWREARPGTTGECNRKGGKKAIERTRGGVEEGWELVRGKDSRSSESLLLAESMPRLSSPRPALLALWGNAFVL